MLPAADQTLIRIQSIITAELVERQTLFPTNVAMHIFYPTIRQTFCTSDNAMVELGRVLFQVEYLDQLCFPCSTTSSSSCRPFHSFEEWRNQYCSISRLMDATDFCQIRLSTLPVPLRIPHIVTLFLITPSFSAFGSGPGTRLDLELQAPTAFLSPAPISCSHSLQSKGHISSEPPCSLHTCEQLLASKAEISDHKTLNKQTIPSGLFPVSNTLFSDRASENQLPVKTHQLPTCSHQPLNKHLENASRAKI